MDLLTSQRLKYKSEAFRKSRAPTTQIEALQQQKHVWLTVCSTKLLIISSH